MIEDENILEIGIDDLNTLYEIMLEIEELSSALVNSENTEMKLASIIVDGINKKMTIQYKNIRERAPESWFGDVD